MPLVENLAPFFNPSELGTTALYNGATIVDGVFESVYVSALSDAVSSVGPVFTCAAISVLNVAPGDTLAINGTGYNIVGIEPDWPVVVLRLERQ